MPPFTTPIKADLKDIPVCFLYLCFCARSGSLTEEREGFLSNPLRYHKLQNPCAKRKFKNETHDLTPSAFAFSTFLGT